VDVNEENFEAVYPLPGMFPRKNSCIFGFSVQKSIRIDTKKSKKRVGRKVNSYQNFQYSTTVFSFFYYIMKMTTRKKSVKQLTCLFNTRKLFHLNQKIYVEYEWNENDEK